MSLRNVITAAVQNGPTPATSSTKPFWLSDLHELDSYQSPAFPQSCDVLIVGGGYAGISAAYHLLCDEETKASPSPNIMLLEARGACSGATARNGGHVRPSVYSRLSKYIADYNEEAAVAVADFEVNHLKALSDLVKHHGIDCEFKLTKSFDVYTDVESAARAKADYLELKQRGIAKSTIDDLTWHEGEDAANVSGVKSCVGCFVFTAGKCWPYKLFMHILSLAHAAGLNIQTHTPALGITTSPLVSGAWNVITPRGTITTKKLIISANGFASTLLPEYSSKIVPARGICCHITVPADKPSPPVLQNTYGLRLPGLSHDYLIQRADNSIIVGGARSAFFSDRSQWYGVTDDSSIIKPAEHYFDDYMQRHFHGWENSGAKVDSIWTGIMGYTSDSLPHIGKVPGKENVYIAAGFQGHGMPVIWLAMKGLAKIVGKDASWEDSGIPNLYKTTAERLQSTRDDLAEPKATPVPPDGIQVEIKDEGYFKYSEDPQFSYLPSHFSDCTVSVPKIPRRRRIALKRRGVLKLPKVKLRVTKERITRFQDCIKVFLSDLVD